ncbi:MAG TPA: hypothetical protein PKM07_09795 [Spirochaetota bacterium]|nr:hypothetical protein [Spirochaetota bacterium]
MEIFTNSIFQTIFSAVIIFILSQYVLERFIKPRMELKKLHALISEKILLYQDQITNGTLSNYEIDEIRAASAKLLSYAWMVFVLDYKKKQYIEISREINGLLTASITKDQKYISITSEGLNKLKKYKFLKISYD